MQTSHLAFYIYTNVVLATVCYLGHFEPMHNDNNDRSKENLANMLSFFSVHGNYVE